MYTAREKEKYSSRKLLSCKALLFRFFAPPFCCQASITERQTSPTFIYSIDLHPNRRSCFRIELKAREATEIDKKITENRQKKIKGSQRRVSVFEGGNVGSCAVLRRGNICKFSQAWSFFWESFKIKSLKLAKSFNFHGNMLNDGNIWASTSYLPIKFRKLTNIPPSLTRKNDFNINWKNWFCLKKVMEGWRVNIVGVRSSRRSQLPSFHLEREKSFISTSSSKANIFHKKNK